MKPLIFVAVMLLLAGLAFAPPAWASIDATAFLGATVKPSTTSTRGASLGFGFVIVGFEAEYAGSTEDPASGKPSLQTGSFNALLQTPVPIGRMQFYATAGAGLFREELAGATVTSTAVNAGGGVKITLIGPVRLRIDYRVFKLNGNPLSPRVQRLYAGVNLKF